MDVENAQAAQAVVPDTPIPAADAAPPIADAPAKSPAAADPPAQTPKRSFEEDILGDLTGDGRPPAQKADGDPAAAEAEDAAAKAEGDTADEKRGEDGLLEDPALIRQREHYLKELNKLRQREAEVAAEREELERLRAGLEKAPVTATDAPKGAPGGTLYEQFVGPELDLEQFEHDGEKLIAQKLNQQRTQMMQMLQGMEKIYNSVAAIEQVEMQGKAQQIVSMLESGAHEVAEQFGLAVTPEELGESLLRHGQAIAAKNGGYLPPDGALQAFLMDNAATLVRRNEALAKQAAAKTVTPPVKKAPAPPSSGTGVARTARELTDDEKVLADLAAAG